VTQNPWTYFDPLGLEQNQWHHRFPANDSLARFFKNEFHINVHDSRFGLFLPVSDHQKFHKRKGISGDAYVEEWKQWRKLYEADSALSKSSLRERRKG